MVTNSTHSIYSVTTVQKGECAPVTREVDVEKLSALFESMTLYDIKDVKVRGGTHRIIFRQNNNFYTVDVTKEVYTLAIGLIMRQELSTLIVIGDVGALAPIGPGVKIRKFSLLFFSTSQAPFLASLAHNTFLTQINLDKISEENFATLVASLKMNHVVKSLQLRERLTSRSVDLFIDLLIRQCFLRTLILGESVSSKLIYAILRHNSSLTKFTMCWNDTLPQWVYRELEQNSTLQEFGIVDRSNRTNEIAKQIAKLDKNRVLQIVTVKEYGYYEVRLEKWNYPWAHRLLSRNTTYTELAPREDKPDIRVLNGFSNESLRQWIQSSDAPKVKVLIINRMI